MEKLNNAIENTTKVKIKNKHERKTMWITIERMKGKKYKEFLKNSNILIIN